MIHSSKSEVLTSPAHYGQIRVRMTTYSVENVDIVISDTFRDGHFGLSGWWLDDVRSGDGNVESGFSRGRGKSYRLAMSWASSGCELPVD